MATKGQKKGHGEKLAALAIDSFIGTLKTVTLAGTAENSAAVMGEPGPIGPRLCWRCYSASAELPFALVPSVLRLGDPHPASLAAVGLQLTKPGAARDSSRKAHWSATARARRCEFGAFPIHNRKMTTLRRTCGDGDHNRQSPGTFSSFGRKGRLVLEASRNVCARLAFFHADVARDTLYAALQTGLRRISNRPPACRNGNSKKASRDWRRKTTNPRPIWLVHRRLRHARSERGQGAARRAARLTTNFETAS